MEDITNHIRNVSRTLERREYDIRFTRSDIRMLYNALGNLKTHPSYPTDNPVVKQFLETAEEVLRKLGSK